jgi:short subunit dehydrogenase-like uncharacterized protein
MQWMIHGASGHTSALIARQAVGDGPQPFLAGRNAAAVGALPGSGTVALCEP